MSSSSLKRSGDGAYYAPTKSKTNSTQIQASDLKKGDRVVFAQQAKTVSSVSTQRNGKVGISFTTGGITDLRPDQTLPRAAPARAPKVSVNQSGRAGKFVAAKAPDKKWAMNPNNPRNHQRHPDDDRASKRIIRAPQKSMVQKMEERNAAARKAGTSWNVNTPPQWVKDQQR